MSKKEKINEEDLKFLKEFVGKSKKEENKFQEDKSLKEINKK